MNKVDPPFLFLIRFVNLGLFVSQSMKQNYVSFSGLAATETDILAQLEEPRQPRMNIGRDYQADLPEICTDRIDLHHAPEQLLWDPGINDRLKESEGQGLPTN